MHPAWEQLADYVDKKLSATEADQITHHLATCEQCAQAIEWLDDTTRLMRVDTFVAPPRNVRIVAELAFEQRFAGTAPAVSPPPISAAPRPPKLITPPTAYWRRSLGIVAAIAAVLILWVVAVRSGSRPLVASLASSRGEVEIQQGQAGSTIFDSDGLTEGSAVRTGDESTAQIAFWNGAADVVMLGGSHIIYQSSEVQEDGTRQVNLMTDTAGDLELDAEPDVTIHLQTGIGLVETKGGRFRFHYLEPKIVALNVVRGIVTVTNEEGDVYDLDLGEHILDYSQPHATHTPEISATETVTPEPTNTVVPATATTLPTRAAPTFTVVPTDEHGNGEHEDNSGSGGGDHDASVSDSATGTESVSVTRAAVFTATTVPPTVAPEPTATTAPPPPPAVPEPEENNSGSSEHEDNSGSGGGGNDHDDNSGSGGGGNDHDDNSGSGGGGNDHNNN